MIELSHRDQFEMELLEKTGDPFLAADAGHLTDVIIQQFASILSHITGTPEEVLAERLWAMELEDKGSR